MKLIHVIFQLPFVKASIRLLGKIMSRLPHLPRPAMEVSLSLMPGIVIALAILHSVAGFVVIVSSNYWFDHPFAPVSPIYLMIIGMLSLANGLLLLISYNDIALMNRRGWESLVIIVLVSLIAALLGVAFFPEKLLGFVVSVLLSLYILFEAKPYFRNH